MVYLSYGVRQKITLVQGIEDRDKLYFIAEAGAKKAMIVLRRDYDAGYDYLNSLWGNNVLSFMDTRVGEGRFNICYEYADKESGIRCLRYGLIDEERRLNLNFAGQYALERLFRIVLDPGEMKAQELAAAVVDWRDGDSSLSIPVGSAEDRQYRNFHYPYESKDSDFEVKQELLLVKGMDSVMFNAVKDYVTVYGSGKVNVNTATRQVLISLGLSRRIVDEILSFRYGEDETPFTEDDNAFTQDGGIVSRLSQYSDLSASEVAELTAAMDKYLTVKSSAFEAKITAGLNRRKRQYKGSCVIDKEGKILFWQEV